MRYLLPQYKDSLHKVRQLKQDLAEARTTKKAHIEIDKETKEVKSVVDMVEKQPVTDPETILTGIIDSLQYSIDWLEHNREPGLRRGADRRSGEQREVPMDPQSYAFQRLAVAQRQTEGRVSVEDRELLEDYLSSLAPSEREAYTLVKGRGMSYAEAGKLMGCGVSTVQCYVERAEEKLHGKDVQRVMFTEVV